MSYQIYLRPVHPNELYHHGIKGQKWGVRRFQNPDGSLTEAGVKRYGYKVLKKSRTANLDQFGKDSNHNVLYIAGRSGSGKSTLATALAKGEDTTIHLDAYSEPGDEVPTNPKFNRFLDKRVPDWQNIKYATREGTGSKKKFSEEYFKTVDSIRDAIADYGKEEYKNRNRVIVEGVQISDDWLAGDKKYYKGKPIVITGTNPITSMSRAFERDGRGPLVPALMKLDNPKEYLHWSRIMTRNLNTLAKETSAGKGWVKAHKKQLREALL